MNKPPARAGKEQLLLRHARREGLIIMMVWATSLVWSVGSGYFLGYRRPAEQIGLILGMPDWVFWSVVLPWGLCVAFATWFSLGYMADDDLGQDPAEGHGHG